VVTTSRMPDRPLAIPTHAVPRPSLRSSFPMSGVQGNSTSRITLQRVVCFPVTDLLAALHSG
jgi:hypothetical protein